MLTMRTRQAAFLIIGAILWSSCDKGLAPPPAMPGKPSIAGTITFAGNWPPVDSVKHLVLVLIPGDPPYKVSDLIAEVINGSILSVFLNHQNSDTSFRFDNLVLGRHYGYLGVAQQFTDSIYRDWRSVGFWHDDRDSAKTFDAMTGDSVTGITIRVNFDSLPWQPFIP